MSIRLCPQSITRSRGTSRLAIANVSIFLSALSAGSEADVPRCGVNHFFAAANKICCIAARNFADLFGHCKIIGAEKGGLMARLRRPMPVEISEAGSAGWDQVRLFSIARRTSSADVRTPSFWRMMEDVLAMVL